MKCPKLLTVLLTFFPLCACGGGSESEGNDVTKLPDGIIVLPDTKVDNSQEAVIELIETSDTAVEPETVVNVPTGYLDFCISDADCSAYGLKCFTEGPVDQNAVCSKECQTGADCPSLMVCKRKGEFKICRLAEYCDTCEYDAQCGTKGKCIQDEFGNRFCSYACKKDDPGSCKAGHWCRKTGTGLEEFFCFPMFGKCKGDGTHCTPCQYADDCLPGHVCHENPTTFETYCAKTCQTKIDCEKGFGCHSLVGEKVPLCTMEINEVPVETCFKGNKDFCEPCMNDYECKSGLCYNYPVENRYFCSFACDGVQWPKGKCPSGLSCAPNHSPSKGDACIPPTAWGCQGFLNCLGVECMIGEKCVDGFCQPK